MPQQQQQQQQRQRQVPMVPTVHVYHGTMYVNGTWVVLWQPVLRQYRIGTDGVCKGPVGTGLLCTALGPRVPPSRRPGLDPVGKLPKKPLPNDDKLFWEGTVQK